MSNIAKMIAIAKRFGGSSGPSEVVILPETVSTVDAEANNMAPIMTPLSATPTDGATAEITYNGAKYTSPIVYDEQNAMFAMGNTEPAGIQGGNADAPFFVGLIPEGLEGIYAMVLPLDGATTVTISIVQVGAASGGGSASAGGGIFEVNVPVTTYTTNTGHDFGEFDKTFAELVAAQKAGKIVRINVNWGTGHATYGNVIGYAKVGTVEAIYISMPVSPNLMQQVAVYLVMAGENGEIVTELIGAD